MQRLRPGTCTVLSLNKELCSCQWNQVLIDMCCVSRRRSWRSRASSTRATDSPWLRGTRWTPHRYLQTCLPVWVSMTYAGASWTEPRGSTPSPEPFSQWASWCLTCSTGLPTKFYGTRTCWPHCDDAKHLDCEDAGTFNSALFYETFTDWESSLEPCKMRCDGASSLLTWKGHWFRWNFNTCSENALLIDHCCSVH